ncbi:DKNYY domain-containing protein [Akkermansiaceae bacterium]|nr:DKNYY domain-containing protein [Akkermansiaceae bacterium]
MGETKHEKMLSFLEKSITKKVELATDLKDIPAKCQGGIIGKSSTILPTKEPFDEMVTAHLKLGEKSYTYRFTVAIEPSVNRDNQRRGAKATLGELLSDRIITEYEITESDAKTSKIVASYYLNGPNQVTLIKDNLYEKNGQLFLKTPHIITMDSKLEEISSEHTFYLNKQEIKGIKGMAYADQYRSIMGSVDEDIPTVYLSEIIDKDTWQAVSSDYYTDKKNLYYHAPDSSGALWLVKEIDPSSIMFYEKAKWLGYEEFSTHKDYKSLFRHYLSDGKNVYFGTSLIKGVDLETFKLMDKVEGAGVYNLAADKQNVYYKNTLFTQQDYESIISNILDSKGKLIDASEEHKKRLRAVNRILSHPENSKFPPLIPSSLD